MKIFANLKVKWKLTVIVSALFLPIVALVYLLVAEKNLTIDFGQKEIYGVEYLRPVRGMLQHVAEHRGMTNAYLSGDDSFREKILAKRNIIAEDIKAVDAVDSQYGAVLDSSANWQAIKADWEDLKSKAMNLEAEQSFTQHTALITKVLDLTGHVGDTSNLILDPDLDSYYLMDLVVVKLPTLAEDLGVLRGKAAGIAARGAMSDDAKVTLISMTSNARSLVEATRRSAEVAFENNDSLKALLASKLDRFLSATGSFMDVIDQRIVRTTDIDIPAAEVFSAGTGAITEALNLYDAVSPALVDLLQIRIDGFAGNRNVTLGIVAAVVAVALLLTYWIAISVSGPIRRAGEVADAIASGDLDNTIEADSKDEAGWLLQSLKTMQENLRDRIEADRRLAAETSRLKQALDNVSANLMVADSEHNIIYINNAIEQTFRDAQAEIRKDVPNFDVENLVGASMDLFHKTPAHRRSEMAELTTTHKAEIKMGGRTFRFAASPVIDATGERLGTVVEWTDRTAELAVEDEVQSIVESAKAGDLSQRIALDGKEGFFGTLSSGINELVDVSERVINDTVRVLGAMAQGDLSETIEADYQGAFDQLKHDANATVAKLTEIIGQVKAGADEINTGADEISQGNTNLSQRTEEQASSLEQTASSMEEMTGTVKQNADNAAQANQLASGARQQAEQGGEVVSQAVSAMSEINSSSKKIADIIGVIDEIAFQTNLLALNAAVEAARAGEQGRGFAVVATEVRNLAQRSATAAKEIKELIEDSVGKVEDGSKLVDQSGQTLDEIVNSVKKVSDIVAEIAAASQEQSSGIEQVNKAIVQMDEMTQQNAALVEEAAAASESMSEQARNMNSLMAFFQVGDESPSTVTAEVPRQERRSPNRAWTGAKVEPSKPAPKKVVAGGGDDEWEEF